MSLARHGTGANVTSQAFIAKIHPVFMLPPIASAAFGAILAGIVAPGVGLLHMTAIFGAMYTAHLKDSYIDFHVRGEDDDCPLTARGCWVGIGFATIVTFASLLGLFFFVDAWAVALTLPCWLIGYLHAPQLDTNPLTTTIGYPTGIALAILGGYYVQVQTLTLEVIAIAGIFLFLLSGVKIVDDLQDYRWDRTNGKRTVGVVFGVEKAQDTAIGLMAAALVSVIALSITQVIEPTSALAVVAFAPVLYLARERDPQIGTMLLIRGSYVFLAVLVAAAWIRPIGH